MKLIKAFLLTVLIFISSQAKSTAVIVLIYPDRIILSVDSRLTYTDNKTGEKKYNTSCKLSSVNSFAFAFTGYRGFAGKVASAYGNFNTDFYIRSVLSKHANSLDNTFSQLVEGLEKELSNQMRILKRLNFKDYSQYLKQNSGNFINLVVIGNDYGVPFAFALNGTLSEVKGTPLIKAKASIFKNKTTIIHAGGTDAAARYIKANPTCLQKEQPLVLIDTLMSLVIKDKPLDVGPPIDIIEATKEGVKWIRQKKSCPN